MSTLQVRLNDREYQNWVKAGLCLLYTKEGLEDFVTATSLQLHQTILANLTRSSITNTGQPVCGASIYRQQLVTVCHHPYSHGFLNAVIQEGLDTNNPFTLRHGNLTNSDVTLWHSQPYEVAKLFMNPGQAATQSCPAETDLSGLINYIAHCKLPRAKISSIQFLEEVRSARNAVMHASAFKVLGPDLKTYSQSMVNLLNDMNISSSPRAQHAAALIKRVVSAVDFTITLEDESKLLTSLTKELHTMTVEIKQKLAEVESCAERDAKETRKDIEHAEEEMRKVGLCRTCSETTLLVFPRGDTYISQIYSLYSALERQVNENSELQDQMEDQLAKLHDLLRRTIQDQNNMNQRLKEVEEQQKQSAKTIEHIQSQQQIYQNQTKQAMAVSAKQHDQTRQEIENLEAHQKTFTQLHIQTHKKIENLHAQHETYKRQINYSVVNIRAEQQEYQRKTDEAIGDLQHKSGQIHEWTASDTEKSQLVMYLKEGYKEKLDVTLLPDWEQIHVSEIFTPSVLVCDETIKNQNEQTGNLDSYRTLFLKDNVLHRRILLAGEAGAGKTTFCKHLTDIWCDTTTTSHLTDAMAIRKFHYLFYVSCRYANKEDKISDMINDQLFDDEEMKRIAAYVLQHCPECCLIIVDGVDEWRGSPSSDTGRKGDMTGLPGITGVQDCTILFTCRPWRFQALSAKSQNMFRRLKIIGIKNVQKLAQRILQKLEDPNPSHSTLEFLRQVRERNMSELMETPLILIIVLGGWMHDKSLHTSMCINYINMLQSFISRSKGHAGWSGSENRLRRLISNIDNLEIEWEQQSKKLPQLLYRYKPLQRYAGLLLSLGHLAFDLLVSENEQILVFTKTVFKSYLRSEDENDESLNVSLSLGILSKTETTFRGVKKFESYAFCHKTFQEFFAALWLACNYPNEKFKLRACIKNVNHLLSYNILIQFLCSIDPKVGKQFWNMEGMKTMNEKVQDLVCTCMKEHGFDPIDGASDQIYFHVPHIIIDWNTSNKDTVLLCNVMKAHSSNVKSLFVEKCQCEEQTVSIIGAASFCVGLQSLVLLYIHRDEEHIKSTTSYVLDLQKHNKLEIVRLEYLFVKGLLLPVETTLTYLSMCKVTMTKDGIEQLWQSLSSCISIEKLELKALRCIVHSDGFFFPVLDIQKLNSLEQLWLWNIAIEGLLPPMNGMNLASFWLNNVIVYHDGLKNMSICLSSYSGLKYLDIHEVKCGEHTNSSCISVVDLRNHSKLETLKLWGVSVAGLLLPVEGLRLTSVTLYNVPIAHEGLELLGTSLSFCSELKCLNFNGVRCGEHIDMACLSILDLHKNYQLGKVELRDLTIKGLLLPVKGSKITTLHLDNVTMDHHGLKHFGNSLSFCFDLVFLDLNRVGCNEHSGRCCLPILDLQKHTKLRKLVLEDLAGKGLLLPVKGSNITLHLDKVKMDHNGLKHFGNSLSFSRDLVSLDLNRVGCNEHSDRCCLPILDLQKHDKLRKLVLQDLAGNGLLLPVKGSNITIHLDEVTMDHNGLEQLRMRTSLAACPSLVKQLYLRVKCSQHGYKSCEPAHHLCDYESS